MNEVLARRHFGLPTELFPLRSCPANKRKAEPSAATNWPSGKAVKIAFKEKDGANATQDLMWNPHVEKLQDVITKAVADITDFQVSYLDQDGAVKPIDATESATGEFLEHHNHHPDPKLQADRGC